MNSKQIYNDNSHLIRWATYASCLTALIIIIAKTIGWLTTGSLSILASLVDSSLDLVASIINLFAARYSLTPPDNDHRFGHGKAEDLAVFTQSAFFGLSGLFVAGLSIKRLFFQQEISKEFIGMGLMLFSICLTSILVLFQRYVMKKAKSNVIEADHFHYFIDLLTNSGTVLALLITSYTGINIIDPIFALFLSTYIIYGSYKLFSKSVNNLMDKEFNDEEKKQIIKLITSHPEVKGFHDLKTRYSGVKPIIQFHLELDGKISLTKAHTITDEVKKIIKKEIPSADITIHQDPEGVEERVDYKDEYIQ